MQMALFDTVELPPKNLGGRPSWDKAEEYQRLTDYLIRRGYYQKEIAAEIGVSVPTLRLYFSGSVAWHERWGHLARTRNIPAHLLKRKPNDD